jgi:hypothetical protein
MDESVPAELSSPSGQARWQFAKLLFSLKSCRRQAQANPGKPSSAESFTIVTAHKQQRAPCPAISGKLYRADPDPEMRQSEIPDNSAAGWSAAAVGHDRTKLELGRLIWGWRW